MLMLIKYQTQTDSKIERETSLNILKQELK